MGFLDYDSYYKDHNYEGWVGWVASSIYVGEFIYFMNGITETSRREKQKVKEFIFLLGLYGSLYFLSFPILQTVNLVETEAKLGGRAILPTPSDGAGHDGLKNGGFSSPHEAVHFEKVNFFPDII